VALFKARAALDRWGLGWISFIKFQYSRTTPHLT